MTKCPRHSPGRHKHHGFAMGKMNQKKTPEPMTRFGGCRVRSLRRCRRRNHRVAIRAGKPFRPLVEV